MFNQSECERPPSIVSPSTERQEAVDAGFAEMVGVDPKRVLRAVNRWWTNGAIVPNKASPFGDGNASERTVKILRDAGYC